ncbi:helix-turn-helix domain-containing protein [bacterium]|nr:helix-turn-helix domain-containing protein [bacterium]
MPKEKNNLALFKNERKIRKVRAINLLTPQEVAERLRLTRRTIMKYIREGKIKAIKLNRRIYRISEKDLNLFLKKCKRK